MQDSFLFEAEQLYDLKPAASFIQSSVMFHDVIFFSQNMYFMTFSVFAQNRKFN